MSARRIRPALVSLLLLAAFPLHAAGEAEEADREARIQALERKVDLLTEELTRTRQDMGVPEEGTLESSWGLGPAASKIYGVTKGLSIGGYAEAYYSDVVADKRLSGATDRADFLRAVLYTGYKFNDWILFNAEFEFEHASTDGNEASGGGSVSVEFATLDFLLRDEANLRAGLMLLPLGFVNKLHEPPFFYGVRRPEVETQIIPTTLRENGAGLFGRFGDVIEYEAYAVTSLNAAGFDAGGLRGSRTRGNRSLAEDISFVGRLDAEPVPGLLLGGSLMVGNTGQDQRFDTNADTFLDLRLPSTRLTLWDAHAQFQRRGLHLRGLFTMAHVDDADELSLALRATGDIGAGETVAERMIGYYGEVAYEVLQWLAPETGWTLEPFFRYERVDTQFDVPNGFAKDRSREFDVYTAGFSLKPIPNVVIKLDYRNRSANLGELADEINAGIGLVF